MYVLYALSQCAMIVYKKTDEYYIVWQRVKTSGTMSDNIEIK